MTPEPEWDGQYLIEAHDMDGAPILGVPLDNGQTIEIVEEGITMAGCGHVIPWSEILAHLKRPKAVQA